MNIILVIRKKKDPCRVAIMEDRATGKYCFVNLSSGHVCACRFKTYEDALEDLNKHPDVLSWSYMDSFGNTNKIASSIIDIDMLKEHCKKVVSLHVDRCDPHSMKTTFEHTILYKFLCGLTLKDIFGNGEPSKKDNSQSLG